MFSPTFLAFYFPWCFLPTPKASPDFPQFFVFSKVQKSILQTFLPLRLSRNTECHLSPHSWEKQTIKCTFSSSFLYFQEKDTNCTKHGSLKFKLYIQAEERRDFTNKICTLTSTYWKLLFFINLCSQRLHEAANIMPVFKNGGGTHPVNYWATSLAQILCKVL